MSKKRRKQDPRRHGPVIVRKLNADGTAITTHESLAAQRRSRPSYPVYGWPPSWLGDAASTSTYSGRQAGPHPLDQSPPRLVPQLPKPDRRVAVTRWAGPEYRQALLEVGAEPVVVGERTLVTSLDEVHGLLIPGGRDVSPAWYNQRLSKHAQPPDEDRDALELTLIDMALKRGIPVLGVCRGHQLLNVALGGSLHQDIRGHVIHKHVVNIAPNNKLAHIGEQLYVNSLHHQSIARLGSGLRVIARAPDGTVEAIESTEHEWALGIQWHPERQLTPRFNREMHELLRRFSHAKVVS